jgi:hypothetical protein
MKTKLLALAFAVPAAGCAIYDNEPATTPPPPPPSQAASPFDAAAFQWSTQPGVAAIRGAVGYRGAAGAYSCKGAVVALTPDTPFSRRRIMRLYGSADRAAVPVSVVRSRQSSAPSDAFSKFVRTTRCDAGGNFGFDRLPAGGWFVIVAVKPASGEGENVALLRRVQTGRTPQVRSVVMQ